MLAWPPPAQFWQFGYNGSRIDIRIIHSYTKAHEARGLSVVVDVLRAFTTSCYMIDRGVRSILAVADLDTAYRLKKQHPHYLLVGERNGLPLHGFNYGNSPAQMSKVNLQGKTVIFTTTSGVQGVARATGADEIITGAFVNAGTIVSYIKKRHPKTLSFICTDDRWTDNEDHLFTQYVQAKLSGSPVSFAAIKQQLFKHPSSDGFLRNPITPHAKRDYQLCLTLNVFDFVVRAKKEKSVVVLETVAL